MESLFCAHMDNMEFLRVKCISHVLPHSCKVSSYFGDSVSELIYLYKSSSSANKRVSDVVTFVISFMNARIRSGQRTVTYGTPERTAARDDWTPSSKTCCCSIAEESLNPVEYVASHSIIFELVQESHIGDCIKSFGKIQKDDTHLAFSSA